MFMRAVAVVAALLLSMAATASAQEWDEFVSKEDGFKVDFPGTPKVTATTWKSQMDYILPAKNISVGQKLLQQPFALKSRFKYVVFHSDNPLKKHQGCCLPD